MCMSTLEVRVAEQPFFYRLGVWSVEFGLSVPFCFFFWLRFLALLVELSFELGSFI